jgi:hypothetical protein
MEVVGVMFNPVLGVRVTVVRNQPRVAPREIIGSVASPTLWDVGKPRINVASPQRVLQAKLW